MAAPRKTKRPAPSLPARKPMARARRLSLFQRTVETRLAPAAMEQLLAAGQVLSEGGFDGDKFAGSTMVTIDLARTADRFSDPADAATARKLAQLVPTDEHARARARAVALREASTEHACVFVDPSIDVRARAHGARVHLDLDLEATRSHP